ncbi:MAG: AhpC/TSA family protein [Williamsia sp.]|nr:AhpC/TSA family protein [Williamsia sp.]
MLYTKQVFSTVCIITCLLGNLAAQQTPGNFLLNGKWTGAPPAMLYLSYADGEGQPKRDSAQVQNGSFQFKGKITEPAMAYLQIKQAAGAPDGIQLFLEPAVMQLSLDGSNVKEAVLTGSATQKEWDALTKQKEPLRKEIEPLSQKYAAASKAYADAKKRNAPEAEQDTLKYRAAAIHDEFEPYNARMAQLDYTFFEKHPASIVTAYYMRFYVSSLPLDSLKLFYNRFGPATQKTSYGKYVADEISKMQAGSPGSMAKNFSTTTIDGKPLQLADFRGKWVLVDFWASWCVPCRKGNPHLKELYTQYKDKGFEVIGVSDDDRDHAAWKQAVEKDGLPWKHVLRGLKYDPAKGFDRSTDISELYGIHTLPTQLLIDPTGKIVARYGEAAAGHEELDKALAAAFK